MASVKCVARESISVTLQIRPYLSFSEKEDDLALLMCTFGTHKSQSNHVCLHEFLFKQLLLCFFLPADALALRGWGDRV